MPLESIEVSAEVPATPDAVYTAWMSAKGHAAITGASALIAPRAGQRHTAWDGYIHGWVLKVGPGRRATFAWRTTDFAPDDQDSLVHLVVERAKGGARVRLVHEAIPEGQGARYRQGWEEYYLKPLAAHFSKKTPAKPRAAKKTPAGAPTRARRAR